MQRRRLITAASALMSAPVLAANDANAPTAPRATDAPPTEPGRWPLRVHASGRFLETTSGRPFLIHGDTAWSIAVQLNEQQIDLYLDDRRNRNFNAILLNLIERRFSNQVPPYRNAAGQAPFARADDFASTPNEAYWRRVDHIVDGCRRRGILVIANPAYMGYSGSGEGWSAEVAAQSAGGLTRYGAFLASRYRQGNIMWCMGGDTAGAPAERYKQWNVVAGMRTVRQSDLITAHNARKDMDAYVHWKGYPGFNVNSIYTGTTMEPYEEAALAYDRPGPLPFFLIEGKYDRDFDGAPALVRRQPYSAILAGACGHLFGNNPLWGYGEPTMNGGKGPAAALASSLDTDLTRQMAHAAALFTAYPWWQLVPQTRNDLVTSPLAAGPRRVCPALAADGTFAMVWTPGSPIEIDMTRLQVKPVRARWFDPRSGAYMAVEDSPFAPVGRRRFETTADQVLVLDAAPAGSGRSGARS